MGIQHTHVHTHGQTHNAKPMFTDRHMRGKDWGFLLPNITYWENQTERKKEPEDEKKED